MGGQQQHLTMNSATALMTSHTTEGHLAIRKGDLMTVVGREGKWCVVKNSFDSEGNVPVSYVELVEGTVLLPFLSF